MRLLSLRAYTISARSSRRGTADNYPNDPPSGNG